MIQPVILSGGAGTRLWPLSRQKFPKQLLPLTGDDTLLQATVTRLDGLDKSQLSAPIIVGNEEHRFTVAEQMRLIGVDCSIVLEPMGRNTAPALTLAAFEAAAKDADAVLLVMPSDHVILNKQAFLDVVIKGNALANAGAVVTFGITPDSPATGYGYIKATPTPSGDMRIERFVEKPDAATAQTYLDDGSYLWNSGIFMMRASVWLAAIATCEPEIHAACERAWRQRKADGTFIRIDRDLFAACPSKSIDYAVMERLTATDAKQSLPAGMIIPLQAGWSDVGSWDALWDVLPKDDRGNAQRGDVVLEDCDGALAISSSRLVTGIGLRDVVVIETADAVLVVAKDRAQDVKKIVDRLAKLQRPESSIHRKVFRPWGWYDGVDQGARFQVKRIVVNPAGILSLQMHHHRAEHWIVVSGTARVTRGSETYLVSENESTFIPLGTNHRLENPGRVPLEMIEVQSGSYLGEDDIVRFEDVYGR